MPDINANVLPLARQRLSRCGGCSPPPCTYNVINLARRWRQLARCVCRDARLFFVNGRSGRRCLFFCSSSSSFAPFYVHDEEKKRGSWAGNNAGIIKESQEGFLYKRNMSTPFKDGYF